MAVQLNTNLGVKINNVDFSDLVTSATLNYVFDELEVTAFGDSAHKYVKGLQSGTFTISFINDLGSNDILDALLTGWGTNLAARIGDDIACGDTCAEGSANSFIE